MRPASNIHQYITDKRTLASNAYYGSAVYNPQHNRFCNDCCVCVVCTAGAAGAHSVVK